MGAIVTTLVHLERVKKYNGWETRKLAANCVQFRAKSSNRFSRPAQSTALPPLQEKFGRQDCAIAQALSKEA